MFTVKFAKISQLVVVVVVLAPAWLRPLGRGSSWHGVGASVKRWRAPASGWACLPPPPTGPGASSLRQIRAFECSKSLKYMCLGVEMIL